MSITILVIKLICQLRGNAYFIDETPPFQAPVTLMKQWKGEKIREGRGGDAK